MDREVCVLVWVVWFLMMMYLFLGQFSKCGPSMTHKGVILACDDGSELFLRCSPGWNGWLILLLQCVGWGTKAGSSLRGNWLTDGTPGRGVCEVGGLTLCPWHGWPPEVERVCQHGPTFPAGMSFYVPAHMQTRMTFLIWNKQNTNLWS